MRLLPVNGKRLEHRNVLGTLLGLGLNRDKMGDIIPHDVGCDIVLDQTLLEYIQIHIGQVGRVRVNIVEVQKQELNIPTVDMKEFVVTVSSMRIDAVIAAGYRMSRTKAGDLIRSEKCKVNWKLIENPHYTLQPGDLVSLKGFGRLRVENIQGVTKKEKFIVALAVFG
nr:YlmH/Sll1252 family protein [Polycladospora coralii]